jgi:hypothetical protein
VSLVGFSDNNPVGFTSIVNVKSWTDLTLATLGAVGNFSNIDTLEIVTSDLTEIDNLTVNSVAATPLPSTWTLMLGGFIGLAAMAYRRKRNTPLVTA